MAESGVAIEPLCLQQDVLAQTRRVARAIQSPLTKPADTITSMYEQLARAKELAERISDILVRL
ncbi:MAG: hypothetical protein ABIQ47_10635 [Tepidiformaceae bacterium]